MNVPRHGPYLAIDWGTTNRRVYRIGADGLVEESMCDDRGILNVPNGKFAEEVEEIRREMGDLPAICAGMVGSDKGWLETPYVAAPCGVEQLARALHWVEPGKTAIVPGVFYRRGERVDVMRGEEVQFLGATSAGNVPDTALLCQPGTHCKWAYMVEGGIHQFATAMTGEIYALIRQHSLIGSQMRNAAQPNGDFRLGVQHSHENDLLSRLFWVRAQSVSGMESLGDPASYVSGLLIGSDVRARIGDRQNPVHILADPVLGQLYSTAIIAAGGEAVIVDSHSAFAFGIDRIWRYQ